MRISLIVAMDRRRLIGRENGLPWQLPADLAHFKRTTQGKPVIMGRKTYESIGRPLPKRTNIVVSRQSDFAPEGVVVTDSPEAAVEAAGEAEEVMIMGGSEIYRRFLPMADRLYVTEVDGVFEGDAWFPEIPEMEWQEVAREHHEPDERNSHPFDTVVLERR